MTPDAFDNDIRKILDETEYHPSEASWQKLHDALKDSQKVAAGTPVDLPSKRRYFLPASWAAAAALVGVAFVGGYLLYSGNETEVAPAVVKEQTSPKNDIETVAQKPDAKVIAATDIAANNSVQEKAEKGTASNYDGSKIAENRLISAVGLNASVNEVGTLKPKVASFDLASASPAYLPSSAAGMRSSDIGMPYEPVTAAAVSKIAKKQRFQEDNSGGFYAADWSVDDVDKMGVFEDPFVYGASVKAGFPTVGSMQLNAGLTINKDLGKQFFTETTVDLSYTDVRFDKALYYRANENGSVSNLGNSDYQEMVNMDRATGQTTTTYRNNVLGVGLATVLGAKVNKSVTVALGADMYRNFNNDLILKDNPLVSETTLKGTVSPLKWVSLWDAGVRAQVGVKLTNHLGLVGQYRKGLVNYMMDASGAVIKNSSVSLGLNVKFNP